MQDIIKKWSEQCPFEHLKNEIKSLQSSKNEKELIDRFYKNIEFGTGGMRAVIGAGPNRMNEEVVGKATQGLANYILSKNAQEKGVAIAHDCRRNRKEFLTEIASVLAGNGIKVWYFNEPRPTPLLSFAVRYLETVSGIVITASHNPPEYNGYKVYWEDGGQIIPPHDTGIINEIKKIENYNSVKKISFEEGVKKGLIQIISDDLISDYYNELKKLVLRNDLVTKHSSNLKIVYTPLHGASGSSVMGMFKTLGFTNVHKVEEQFQPNENFSTVASPNPEDQSALQMAIELSEKISADLLFANDPDGDRMAVGVKTKDGYSLLNGNQTGSIIEWYILSQLKEKKQLPANGCIVKTIVTSELQTCIADSFGVKTFNTLTGFKYIGGLIKKFEDDAENGKATFRYLFGGEESYGYLPYPIVRDKDGVMALGVLAEIACYAKENNKTLVDLLNDIYSQYSVFLEDLVSITLKGKDGLEKIDQIMNTLRSNPPTSFASVDVVNSKDYHTSVEKDASGKILGEIDLPKSNVLEFNLKDGTRITARPSGTEPKIKFYFSVNSPKDGTIENTLTTLKEKINAYKTAFQKLVGE